MPGYMDSLAKEVGNNIKTKSLNDVRLMEAVSEFIYYLDRYLPDVHLVVNDDMELDYSPEGNGGAVMNILWNFDKMPMDKDADEIGVYINFQQGKPGFSIATLEDIQKNGLPDDWHPLVLSERLYNMAHNNNYIQPCYQKPHYSNAVV